MYSNFEKEKLGKTFKYYKTTKNIKWDEIKEKANMSKTTFSKMSRGEIVKSNRCYDEYLRFFDLTYKPIEHFETWIHDYLYRLNQTLEDYHPENIKLLNDEYLKVLEEHKEESIYEQYYFSFYCIFKYYLNNEYLNEEEINKILLLIESNMFEETIQVYLLEIMYISNNNAIGSDPLRRSLAELIEGHDHPILYQAKAINEKCEKRMQKSLEIHQKQLEYWNKVNNDYRKTKTLNGMFMIYQNIDAEKAKKIIKELEKAIESKNIPISLVKAINYNVGMYYYLNGYYNEAYPFFIKNVDKYNNVKELIFVGAICTNLNQELPDIFLTTNYKNSNYILYIDYFKFKKQGKSDKELIEFINQTLYYQKLIHSEYYQPLWRIFENEMDIFLKKSKKNYDAYIEFKEKMDKTCKYR